MKKTKVFLLFALAALALTPTVLQAQQCGSVFVGRAPTCCAPHYPTPATAAYAPPVIASPFYNTLLVATPVIVPLPYPTYTVSTLTPQAFLPGGSYGAPATAVGGATYGAPVANVGAVAAAPVANVSAAAASADIPTSGLNLLLAEIKALRADIRAAKGLPEAAPAKLATPPPVPTMPPAGPAEESTGALPKIGTVLAKCVACHDSAVSAKKGGEFAMFVEGTSVKLTNAQAKLVLERVGKKEMPPEGHAQVTAPEYETLKKWIGPIN